MGSKQRLPFILSLVVCNLSFLVLLIIFIPSSLEEATVEVEGDNNGGSLISSTLPSTTALPVCSESVLLSTHQIHRFTGSQGFFVKTVENFWQVPFYWMSSNVTTNFSLIENDLKCSNGVSTVALPKYETEESINSSSKHFYPNGYFRYSRHIYAPDEYCIERFSDLPPSNSSDRTFQPSSVQIRLCVADCGSRPCIRKCCPLNQIFWGGPGGPGRSFCVNSPPGSSAFMPPMYHDFYTKATGNKPNPHFIINHVRSFKKRCEGGVVLPIPYSQITSEVLGERLSREFHHSKFRIRVEDGAVMFKSLENKCGTVKNLNNICIDGVNGAFEIELENPLPFNNTENEYILFQCQVAEKDPNMDKLLSVTFGGLLLATSIFPLITCIIYLLLWKKQNVHGWSIAATSGSLFFMYIFQGSAHLIGVTLKEEALNTFYCKLIAIVSHFFTMSTFTWLTALSADLWLTFRSVVPMNQRLNGASRYLKYSAFGWGVPTVIVSIGILMDFVIYTPNDCSYHAVPAYGQRSCWIVEDALGEYLYYPAAFLVCVNILLFTATCVKLCMFGRGPTVRTRKTDARGECFSRFTKLFCVMGVSWIFEILSWQVDGLGFFWYWNIFDIFNILRAVAVFAIYVCKKDIIIQLEDAYPALRALLRPFSRLFLRKCSDEMSTNTETTGVFSATPSSPCIPLKAGTNPKIVRNNKKSGNLLEVVG